MWPWIERSETQHWRLKMTGLAKPSRTRWLSGMSSGLACKRLEVHGFRWVWNRTELFLRSQPGLLVSFQIPLLILLPKRDWNMIYQFSNQPDQELYLPQCLRQIVIIMKSCSVPVSCNDFPHLLFTPTHIVLSHPQLYQYLRSEWLVIVQNMVMAVLSWLNPIFGINPWFPVHHF